MTQTPDKNIICKCSQTIQPNFKYCPFCGQGTAKNAYCAMNMCDCCGDDITSMCKVCKSIPTPLSKEEFTEYMTKVNNDYSEISKREFRLRMKNGAINRESCRLKGINCSCSGISICAYHSSDYD